MTKTALKTWTKLLSFALKTQNATSILSSTFVWSLNINAFLGRQRIYRKKAFNRVFGQQIYLDLVCTVHVCMSSVSELDAQNFSVDEGTLWFLHFSAPIQLVYLKGFKTVSCKFGKRDRNAAEVLLWSEILNQKLLRS